MKKYVLILAAFIGLIFAGCSDSDNDNDNKEQEEKEQEEKEPEFTREFTVNGVSFKMLPVEGGTFMMGATEEQLNKFGEPWNEKELPVHQVTLSDFYMAETEVTRGLWKAVMGSDVDDQNIDPSIPVTNVAIKDIIEKFLPKLNELTGEQFMLPTEAQWEFAARGGNKSQHYIYSGSNDPGKIAVYYFNKGDRLDWPHAVKSMKPNELGIYDMSGNASELCRSYLGNYTEEPLVDPELPLSDDAYVIRGGHCLSI